LRSTLTTVYILGIEIQGEEETMAEFMVDTKGRQVPITMVSELDKLRDQTVRNIVVKALQESRRLQEFKGQIREDIMSFLDLSSEQYGKSFGGRKGNVTLTSYDGSLKVLLAVNEILAFDERLQIAKEIIDGCIARWSEGARDEIRALINDTFAVDKAGNINRGRILGLRRLAIEDPDWKRAMTAISDAIQVAGSKEYIRIYTRDESGEYKQVQLDVAAL
jgi:hypothetical protein